MNQRKFRHLVSAGLGVVAAPSVAFLFLMELSARPFSRCGEETRQPPGLPPAAVAGVPMHSAWLAAVELAAAGALVGVLAGAGWVSPVAPLVAGLPCLRSISGRIRIWPRWLP